MNLIQYLGQRGWEHLEEHVYINGVEQPLLPDDAVQFPLDQMRADTDPKKVYELATSLYGEFDGPVEYYIWSLPDGTSYEYLTVAMRVFERLREAPGIWTNRTKSLLTVVGALSLVGSGIFLLNRGMR